jgi:CheY-specific phosphatase CheX
MSGEMMKVMQQAISDVMNKMFFLPVQVNEKGLALREWFSNKLPLVGATINFTGPLSGYSYLLIPAGVAKEMTANFLGIAEKEINVKQEMDTVKEALNMITGHMLSQFDRKGDLRIGIPQLINDSDLLAGQLDGFNKGAILIETEHSHIAAGIVIKQADRL